MYITGNNEQNFRKISRYDLTQIESWLKSIEKILFKTKEKELTFDEKIDKQIQDSINGIMLGVRFRLAIKVTELRHKENMLCITINSKFSAIQRKYCYEERLYDTDYNWNVLFNQPFDFSYFRVNRILNINYEKP